MLIDNGVATPINCAVNS